MQGLAFTAQVSKQASPRPIQVCIHACMPRVHAIHNYMPVSCRVRVLAVLSSAVDVARTTMIKPQHTHAYFFCAGSKDTTDDVMKRIRDIMSRPEGDLEKNALNKLLLKQPPAFPFPPLPSISPAPTPGNSNLTVSSSRHWLDIQLWLWMFLAHNQA